MNTYQLILLIQNFISSDTLNSSIFECCLSPDSDEDVAFQVFATLSTKNNTEHYSIKLLQENHFFELINTFNTILSKYRKEKIVIPAIDLKKMISYSKLTYCDFIYRIEKKHIPQVFYYSRKYTKKTTTSIQTQYIAVQDCLIDNNYNINLESTVPYYPSNFNNGYYDIALSQRAASFLMHELFGHGLETRKQLESLWSLNYTFPPAMNIIDNPHIPYAYGSYSHDILGHKSEKIQLMKNGIIINSLDNQYGKKSKKTTSNRIENWSFIASPRVSNFIVDYQNKQGTILQNIKNGILITDFFEGNEAFDAENCATLKTYVAHQISNSMTTGIVYPNICMKISLNLFCQGFIKAYGQLKTRPIDCFTPLSGWVRTTAGSPCLLLHAYLSQENERDKKI